jgi:hypothetical protein
LDTVTDEENPWNNTGSGPHWCVIGGLNFVAPKQRRRNQKKIFGREGMKYLAQQWGGGGGEHLLNAPRLFHTHDVYYA